MNPLRWIRALRWSLASRWSRWRWHRRMRMQPYEWRTLTAQTQRPVEISRLLVVAIPSDGMVRCTLSDHGPATHFEVLVVNLDHRRVSVQVAAFAEVDGRRHIVSFV